MASASRTCPIGALGGLLIPTHGFVAAAELTRALAAAAERHGAHLVDGRIRRDHHGRRSPAAAGVGFDDRGTFQADAVVIAAGSWAGQIQIDGAKTPVAGASRSADSLLHLHWSGPAARRIIWGERCYVVPWPDGTVLVGATEEDAGFDERTTLAAVLDLIDAVCELLPQAWTASLTTAKVGLRPGTPDQVPIIGWSGAVPEPHVCDRTLPERHTLGTVDGGARRQRCARWSHRSDARADAAATIRRTLMG